jgi:hypothetical protein
MRGFGPAWSNGALNFLQQTAKLKRKLLQSFQHVGKLPSLSDFLKASQNLCPSHYCLCFFNFSLNFVTVSSGGVLFDIHVGQFYKAAELAALSEDEQKNILKKDGFSFLWDFCVWVYRDSQKKGKLAFFLGTLLKFYGLSAEGS